MYQFTIVGHRNVSYMFRVHVSGADTTRQVLLRCRLKLVLDCCVAIESRQRPHD